MVKCKCGEGLEPGIKRCFSCCYDDKDAKCAITHCFHKKLRGSLCKRHIEKEEKRADVSYTKMAMEYLK